MLVTVLTLGSLGLIAGLGLALAAKKFAVFIDPRIEEIEAILPGTNCGGCGYPGCHRYAEALVKGEIPLEKIDLCNVGGQEVAQRLGQFMGVEVGVVEEKVAIVLCLGSREVAQDKFQYFGVDDCRAAELIGQGAKACGYGCLGFSTCQRACPFGAITIKDNLAIIDPGRCTGCGRCVEVCPRGLIKLVPRAQRIHILCRSYHKGARVRKICQVGCIGCTKCVKESKEGEIIMDGSLAVMDYSRRIQNEKLIEICPTNTIVIRH